MTHALSSLSWAGGYMPEGEGAIKSFNLQILRDESDLEVSNSTSRQGRQEAEQILKRSIQGRNQYAEALDARADTILSADLSALKPATADELSQRAFMLKTGAYLARQRHCSPDLVLMQERDPYVLDPELPLPDIRYNELIECYKSVIADSTSDPTPENIAALIALEREIAPLCAPMLAADAKPGDVDSELGKVIHQHADLVEDRYASMAASFGLRASIVAGNQLLGPTACGGFEKLSNRAWRSSSKAANWLFRKRGLVFLRQSVGSGATMVMRKTSGQVLSTMGKLINKIPGAEVCALQAPAGPLAPSLCMFTILLSVAMSPEPLNATDCSRCNEAALGSYQIHSRRSLAQSLALRLPNGSPNPHSACRLYQKQLVGGRK